MATATGFTTPLHKQLQNSATQFVWFGVALAIVGIVALVFPAASTFFATLFVGWILIFAGAAMLFGSFSIRGAGPFFGALLFGLLSIAAGAFMLARPGLGALTITITLGLLFIFQGAFETVFAFELRPARGWVWMLISAIASIVLAIAIIMGLPGSSTFALGIVLGINFITSGVAYFLLGRSAKQALA